jgi:transcriptional regulator with XRE-family HTH domain
MHTSEIYQYLGKRIKHYREQQNITQEQLGIALGLSRTSVTNIEAGRQRFNVELAYKIAETLDVNIGLLFPDAIPQSQDELKEQVRRLTALVDRYRQLASDVSDMFMRVEPPGEL